MNEIINIVKEAWGVSKKETIKTIIGLIGIATWLYLFACWMVD